MYSQFFQKANSTKDLLRELDHIHQIVTSKKPNATPPRFKYEWQDDGQLLITYQSKRDLLSSSSHSSEGLIYTLRTTPK